MTGCCEWVPSKLVPVGRGGTPDIGTAEVRTNL